MRLVYSVNQSINSVYHKIMFKRFLKFDEDKKRIDNIKEKIKEIEKMVEELQHIIVHVRKNK